MATFGVEKAFVYDVRTSKDMKTMSNIYKYKILGAHLVFLFDHE